MEVLTISRQFLIFEIKEYLCCVGFRVCFGICDSKALV